MNVNNFRLPAEWEKHQFTLLAFPYEGRDWPGKFHAIRWVFVEIIRKVTLFENVLLVVRSESHQRMVTDMLTRAHVNIHNITFLIKDTNRGWMRDSGPVIVKTHSGERIAIKFAFNGWAKYGNYRKDSSNPEVIAKFLKIPVKNAFFEGRHVVLEGGAIDSNGDGTLITTEECLLDESVQVRNPGFGKKEYEQLFSEYLGIRKVIWLGKGIEGDDTHGHIDDFCRFVNHNTVVLCRESNSKDPNYRILEENFERLSQERLAGGEKLNIIEIPMPSRIEFEDLRLPASYVNFLITNSCVLVPVFNDPNDCKALGKISEVFPGYKIIGLSAIDLVWGLGTLHCLSREIPL